MGRPKKNSVNRILQFERDGTVLECDYSKEEAGEGSHSTASYKLKSMKYDKKKKQKIIVLEENKVHQERNRMIEDLTKAVEDKISKSVIIKDMFKTFKDRTLEDVQKMIKQGEPVRFKEGCIKLVIGKGKKRKTLQMMN